MHLIMRSLPANFNKFQSLLANVELKPHIVSITESWLNNNKNGEFSNLSNYALFPTIESIGKWMSSILGR